MLVYKEIYNNNIVLYDFESGGVFVFGNHIKHLLVLILFHRYSRVSTNKSEKTKNLLIL